jgi:hypothetical protein
MAAKLRPRVTLPRLVSSTAGRAAEARGRQLQQTADVIDAIRAVM